MAFEFPEVLDKEGNFEGFDVIVGNPPYGVKMNQSLKDAIKREYSATEDIYTSFIELGTKLSHHKGNVSFIIPVSWQTGDNYINTRSFIKNNIQLSKGIVLPYDVFDDVYVDTGLYFFSKNKAQSSFVYEYSSKDKVSLDSLNNLAFKEIQNKEWQNTSSLKIVFNVGIRNIQESFQN
ncbi:MAG: Eco57I restriction-modification methylase domain-containing protein [Bacteroidetes bacterium]|nr:Eco57I restriction-modification methylase domain-containing protein [Bacteroidota bacterium]